MDNLKFYFGTMNSSKSANLLMMGFNYTQKGLPVIFISPNNERDKMKIKSRIGISRDIDILIEQSDNLTEKIMECKGLFQYNKATIMIDEVQFFTEKQIDELGKYLTFICPNDKVICTGLLIDFRGKLFDASKKLIEIGAKLKEFDEGSVCKCGNKATHHIRKINGEIVTNGEIELHEVGNVTYESVCYKCFKKETFEKNIKKEFYN